MTEAEPQTTLTKEIEHHFSLDELRNLGVSLANAIADLEALAQEKADFMADFKNRHKDAQAKTKLLAQKIRTGSEVRLDSGELVEERAMTVEERQLFLLPETDPAGPRQINLT